jgi:hypothetical protein
VSTMQPGEMPYSLDRIELRRVRREIVHLDIFAMICKPLPDSFVFVIRCIVLNQIYLFGEVAIHDPFEILHVGESVEDGLKLVKKSSTIQLDCAKDLERISLSCCWNFGLRTYERPCSVERWVLPKTRFVSEEDCRPFGPGFFFCCGFWLISIRS